MNETKICLKISGLLNFIIATMMIFSNGTDFREVILISSGIFILAYSFLDLEELKRKKTILIILSIMVLFSLNIPSLVLLLVTLTDLNNAKDDSINSPPELEISKENKKIDMLLKIGVGMILVSGVLFATTTWNMLPDIVKVILLLIVGTIFIRLSNYSKKVLKIEKTTLSYYILGLAFYLLTFVGIGYFGTISAWFSYSGDGKHLVYFITYILITLFSFLINHNFSLKEFKYIALFNVYLALYSLLSFLNLDILIINLVLSFVVLVSNILIKNDNYYELREVNELVTIINVYLILMNVKDAGILLLINSLVSLVNTTMIALTKKDNDSSVNVSLIASYLLLSCGVSCFDSSMYSLILFFVSLIFAYFIKLNPIKQSESLIDLSQIIFTVMSFINISALCIKGDYILPFVCSIIFLLSNIVNKNDYLRVGNNKVDYYVQPLAIFLVTISTFLLMSNTLIECIFTYFFTIMCSIYLGMFLISKEEMIKKIYYYSLTMFSVFLFFQSLYTSSYLVPCMSLVFAGSLFTLRREEYQESFILNEAFLLLNIYALIMIKFTDVSSILKNILVLIIFSLFAYILKDKKSRGLVLVSMTLPAFSLILLLSSSSDVVKLFASILNSLIAFYFFYIISVYFLDDKTDKDQYWSVVIPLVLLQNIFSNNIIQGVFVGVVGITLLLLCANDDRYKTLFKVGVAITIINILIHLGGYLLVIPFWLYLLLGGIVLIAFVTRKEINKSNQSNESEKIQVNNNVTSNVNNLNNSVSNINNSINQTYPFCPNCGRQNNSNFCTCCGTDLRINK